MQGYPVDVMRVTLRQTESGSLSLSLYLFLCLRRSRYDPFYRTNLGENRCLGVHSTCSGEIQTRESRITGSVPSLARPGRLMRCAGACAARHRNHAGLHCAAQLHAKTRQRRAVERRNNEPLFTDYYFFPLTRGRWTLFGKLLAGTCAPSMERKLCPAAPDAPVSRVRFL